MNNSRKVEIMRLRNVVKAVACAVALAAATGSAQADSYVFGGSSSGTRALHLTTSDGVFDVSAFNSGWYRDGGVYYGGNTNYIVGSCCGYAKYNDWFTFDLSLVTGAVTGASLKLATYAVMGGASTFSLFDVSTSISNLTADHSNGGATGVAILEDLGSGVFYGSREYSTFDSGSIQTIALNGNAIAALNGALGNQFAIGGTLSPGVAPIPEPETYAMMLAGLGLLGLAARRRRQKAAA